MNKAFCGIAIRGIEVAFGSSTDLTAHKLDFRFTPESGLRADIAPCPFRAIDGLMRRHKQHFISPTDGSRAIRPRGAYGIWSD
jgi:hypothetical protein